LHGARPRVRRQCGSHRAMGWLCPVRARSDLHTFNCPLPRGQTGGMADQYAHRGDPQRPTEIPAIRWDEPPEGPVLVVLDQTRLPAEEVVLVCTDAPALVEAIRSLAVRGAPLLGIAGARSEEHTSELQSRENLVCRLLLEKKNTPDPAPTTIFLRSAATNSVCPRHPRQTVRA